MIDLRRPNRGMKSEMFRYFIGPVLICAAANLLLCSANADDLIVLQALAPLVDWNVDKTLETLRGLCIGKPSCVDLLKGSVFSSLTPEGCRAISTSLRDDRKIFESRKLELTCIGLSEGKSLSPQVIELCAKTGKTTTVAKRDLKMDCLRHFEASRSTYSLAGLEYCVTGEYQEFSQMRDCFNTLRDRALPLHQVQDCTNRSRKTPRDSVRDVFKNCVEEEVARASMLATPIVVQPAPSLISAPAGGKRTPANGDLDF